MSKKWLMFIGAIGALATAVGLTAIFMGFATQSYSYAFQQAGAVGLKSAQALQAHHHEMAKARGFGGRRFLARSLQANAGLVYSKPRTCDLTCKGVGCVWQKCGFALIYAEGFARVSFQDGQLKLPTPGMSLWIYVALAGAVAGSVAGFQSNVTRGFAIVIFITAVGWLWVAPLTPAETTILLSGIGGGLLAIMVALYKEYINHSNRVKTIISETLPAMYVVFWLIVAVLAR